jgi:hypothetical protein
VEFLLDLFKLPSDGLGVTLFSGGIQVPIDQHMDHCAIGAFVFVGPDLVQLTTAGAGGLVHFDRPPGGEGPGWKWVQRSREQRSDPAPPSWA